MDSIRVAKVSGVVCTKPASTTTGSLHLTAHHLIYRADGPPDDEMWASAPAVTYPLIALVTRLPQTLRGRTPLAFRCRTFETFTLAFEAEQDAADVFESIRELTVATSVTQLYAFYYQPSPPQPSWVLHAPREARKGAGWALYSPREEFARMGVGSRTKAWRFSDINKDFSLCPTYPARLVVPTRISDTTLSHACKYRSKARIPALTYLHWANFGTLTRSSQPMVGLTNSRSMQDEKLIEAIFQSHHAPDSPFADARVYGATATNLIIDARPTANAVANVARGAGTENMDYYKEGKKAYLGVDNIHVMRDSLAKVVEALREADTAAATVQDLDPAFTPAADASFLDRQALRRSGWLRHISALLEGTVLIVRNVHVNSSHVLIHCSDGWDRTAQLSSLAQLCLDPFYRTMRGFEILIEKDWLSFGHRFLDRCGHLSSEKFFLTATANDATGGAEAAQAFLASVQNRFTSQHHLKETSPVFHQFLECVRQIQRQFPARFEFNERFLGRLHYHLYACQFGTFLFNNEQQRRVGEGGGAPPCERTASAWDWFNAPEEAARNRNGEYDPALDDPMRRAAGADMGVLFPNAKDVRFWHELYGRTDEEMNGRAAAAQAEAGEAGEDDGALDADTPPARPPSAPLASAAGANGVGTGLAASASLPSLPAAPEKPASPRRQFSSVSSAYSLEAGPGEAGPSSPRAASPARRARKPVPALPKLPDALTGGGIRSMWGKLSSNASAAFSVVQDAYEGVTKEHAAPAAGGELQAADAAALAWGARDDDAAAARAADDLHVASNPWATARRGPRTPPAWRPFAEDTLDAQPALPSSAMPFASLPRAPRAVPPPPPSPPPPSPPPPPASDVPLPPSPRPRAGLDPQEAAAPGPQADPLGVGWL